MVENQNNKIVYEISALPENGVPLRLDFPYPFFENSDIHVYVMHVDAYGMASEKELDSGTFTVGKYSGADDFSTGGTVSISQDQLQLNCRITILRLLPAVQKTSLPEFGKFSSAAVEQQLDRIVMICQQLQELGDRCVKWTPGADQTTPSELLAATVEAAKEANSLAAKVFAALDPLREEFEEFATDVNDRIQEIRAELKKTLDDAIDRINAVLERTLAAIASAGVLAEDTTIRFEEIHPLTSAATEDERNEMMTEATNIVRRNQEKIDALPRNLGGNTLTFNIGVQDWEDYEPSLGLARYKFNGFFNGKIVFSGGEISSFFTHRNLWFSNCCTEIRFNNTRFDTGLSGNSFAVSPGAVRFRHCMLAVFSGCTFTGRFHEVGPYVEDTFGYCIAATDTPVSVPVSFEETLLPQNVELGIGENDISNLLDANGVPTPELLLKKYELN